MKNLVFALVLLVAGCGSPNTSKLSSQPSQPDTLQAQKGCAIMFNTQIVEYCDKMIRHIPICDKVCVEFSSAQGSPVSYQCSGSQVRLDTTGICNSRNTWHPF